MSNPKFEFDHVHIISQDPHRSVQWYVEFLGAEVTADTVARGAPQIFMNLGGKIVIVRGRRPGESPTPADPIRPFSDFSSHNRWGTDHFGLLYHGDLRQLCQGLAAKGVEFPVPLKEGVGGKWLCYISAPDGVSIELMQAG